MHSDSVDKIVTSYFACVTRRPFLYKGKAYRPKSLLVSPGLFRDFTCPAGCGACCRIRFSLDYLPTEPRPYELKPRRVMFNHRPVLIYSDLQADPGRDCGNLQADGRCGIHGRHPFSCDFEVARFSLHAGPDKPNQLNTRLFGRGWMMLRVDGQRGAKCEMLPVSDEGKQAALRRMRRLDQWCRHFGVTSMLDEVIPWVESGPHDRPLLVMP